MLPLPALLLFASVEVQFHTFRSPGYAYDRMGDPHYGLTLYDLSSDGSTLVGLWSDQRRWMPFRWRSSDGETLLSSDLMGAGGVSADGGTAVGGRIWAEPGTYAFQKLGKSTTPLTEIGLPDNSVYLWDVSDDGSLAVGSADKPGGRSVLFLLPIGEKHMLIKDKKGNFIEGSFISISGDKSTVASTAVQSRPWQPFLWTKAGGVKNLPVPGGSQSCRVLSLSTDGKSAFGIQVDKSGEGVLWRNGRIANPFPAGFQPKAMAQDGQTFAGVVDGEVAFWSKPLGIHKIGDLHPKWAGFAAGVEQVRPELIKVQKGSIAIAGRTNREDAWWMQIPLSRL